MASTKALRAAVLCAMVKSGKPQGDILQALSLSPEALVDPDGRVPHSTFDRAWDLAAQFAGDPNFGLSVAEILDGAPSDSFDFITWYAPNVGEMSAALRRYQRLLHDGARVEIETEGDLYATVLRLNGCAFTTLHPPAFIITTWLLRIRHATGVRIKPHAVTFRAPAPPDLAPWQRILDAPVHFGAARDALVVHRATLDLPVLRANESLFATFQAHAMKRLAQSEDANDDERWLALFRARLMESILRGDPTVERVADLLHASSRTLQRRLADGATSFREQLDLVRRELATSRLRDAGSVTDVAFLLGFSDVTAFTRAFRRWTGTTPVRYLRESAGAA